MRLTTHRLPKAARLARERLALLALLSIASGATQFGCSLEELRDSRQARHAADDAVAGEGAIRLNMPAGTLPAETTSIEVQVSGLTSSYAQTADFSPATSEMMTIGGIPAGQYDLKVSLVDGGGIAFEAGNSVIDIVAGKVTDAEVAVRPVGGLVITPEPAGNSPAEPGDSEATTGGVAVTISREPLPAAPEAAPTPAEPPPMPIEPAPLPASPYCPAGEGAASVLTSTDIRGGLKMSGDRLYWLSFDGGNAISSATKAGTDPRRTALPNTSFMQDAGGVTGITSIGVDERYFYWGAIYPQTNEINSVFSMDRATGAVTSVSGGTHRIDVDHNFYAQNIIPTGSGMLMGNITWWETSTGVALGRLSYWDGGTLRTVATDTFHPTTVYDADKESLYYSGKDGITRITRDGGNRQVIAPRIQPYQMQVNAGHVIFVGDHCFWPVQNDPDCVNGWYGSGAVGVMDTDGGNVRRLVDFINDSEFTTQSDTRPTVSALFVDSAFAYVQTQYWSRAEEANISTIYRFDLSDGTRTTLYTHTSKTGGGHSMVADDTCLYWVNSDYQPNTGVHVSTIMRQAR